MRALFLQGKVGKQIQSPPLTLWHHSLAWLNMQRIKQTGDASKIPPVQEVKLKSKFVSQLPAVISYRIERNEPQSLNFSHLSKSGRSLRTGLSVYMAIYIPRQAQIG